MERLSTPSSSSLCKPASRAGFGQVQLILCLVCLGLAVCLSTLWVRRHRTTERCDAYLEDVRAFAQAYRKFFEKNGFTAPGGGASPAVPAGMEPYLAKERWLQPTPFGGNYHWLSPYPPDGPAPTARDANALLGAVQVNGFPPRTPVQLSASEIAYLKERFAEHAVPGTKIVFGFKGWPICIVQATQ